MSIEGGSTTRQSVLFIGTVSVYLLISVANFWILGNSLFEYNVEIRFHRSQRPSYLFGQRVVSPHGQAREAVRPWSETTNRQTSERWRASREVRLKDPKASSPVLIIIVAGRKLSGNHSYMNAEHRLALTTALCFIVGK